MTRTISFLLVSVFLMEASVAAGSPGQARGRKQREHENGRSDTVARADVHIVFNPGDVVILREHYGPRYNNLPPGLQRKVARGGQLPPGWQKKFEPFPVGIERRLTPLPPGYRRGVIDAHAVIYDVRTNMIIDLAALF